MDKQARTSASMGLQIKTTGTILVFSLFLLLSACNAFGEPEATLPPTQNVTQAYQTVEARLTEVIAQTPTITKTPTVDAEATLTPTLTPTNTYTPTPTPAAPTLSPTPLCDRAAAGTPLDLTIPDDTQFTPGEHFTKEWSVVNVGSCSWTRDYSLVWVSGDLLSAPATIDLPVKTDPGEKVTLSVDMIAPAVPGTYQSNWKLQNTDGLLFGLGPSGAADIWVRIIVTEGAGPTASPTTAADTTPTPTPTAVPGAAGAVTLQVGEGIDLDGPPAGLIGTGDLVFDQLGGASAWLSPQPGVLLSIFGGIEPGLEDCQAAPLSDAPIPVDSLSNGFYLCYQTDQGQPGRVQLISFDAAVLTVDLDYLTWGP